MQNNVSYTILSVEKREIWSLGEVKNYLRVSHTNDDKLITNLISSAVITAEQFLALSFCIKKVTCLIDKTPTYLRLKYIPVTSLTKVFLFNSPYAKTLFLRKFISSFIEAILAATNNLYLMAK